MITRKKMKDRYRRFSHVSVLAGVINALGEMRGIGFTEASPAEQSRRHFRPLKIKRRLVRAAIRDKVLQHTEN